MHIRNVMPLWVSSCSFLLLNSWPEISVKLISGHKFESMSSVCDCFNHSQMSSLDQVSSMT